MNFKTMMNSIGFFFKKNSPVILLVSGIAASAGSVITACVATRKLDKEQPIKAANEKLTLIENRVKNNEMTEQQAKKEKFGVFTKTGWKFVKLYSIPVVLFGISTTCLVSGNKIMATRNAALSAGFSALQSSYMAYRDKVAEKIGKEGEQDIYKETINKKNDETFDSLKESKKSHNYDFFFDSSCEQWEPDGRLNLDYLNTKENYLNRILQVKGYITMYDILFGSHGFALNPALFSDEVIMASHFFGWTRDGDSKQDHYVSLGLYDKDGENTIGAINMQKYGEKNFFVRFNNPYYIYDRIPKLMKENR